MKGPQALPENSDGSLGWRGDYGLTGARESPGSTNLSYVSKWQRVRVSSGLAFSAGLSTKMW